MHQSYMYGYLLRSRGNIVAKLPDFPIWAGRDFMDLPLTYG